MRRRTILIIGILILAALGAGVLARQRSSEGEDAVLRSEEAITEESGAENEAGEDTGESAWYDEPEETEEMTTGEEDGTLEEEDGTLEEGTFSSLETSIRKAIRNKKYILENSDSDFLEWSDVKGLSSEEIGMARNEIYARHGYKFKKKQVLQYFQAKKWYKAKVDPSDFKESKVFNEAEKYNVKYLKSLETVQGLKGMSTAASKKKVDSYGYANGYSKLSFKLKKGSLVKKSGYYEVKAVYRKAITVPGDLKVGDSVKVSFDDLKGKKLTLVRDKEGLYVKGDPTRQFEYVNSSGKVTLYEDSADRVDKPVYEGKLYIREDAVTGRWLGSTKAFSFQKLKKKNMQFNAVTFDSKGYVVRLMTIGD